MTSITEAILSKIEEMRANYPAETVDEFLVRSTIHWERNYFQQAWFGTRGHSTVADVYLKDLNFALEDSCPGDQPSEWSVKKFKCINYDYTSEEEHNLS